MERAAWSGYADVEQRAFELLLAAGVTAPPVPVDAVARHTGITAITAGKISSDALLVRAGAVLGVVLNANAPKTRRRFLIAHEIGHVVLGSAHRIVRRRRSLDVAESLVDYFATCLLMPTNWIAERAERGMTNGELAKAFDVSRAALIGRLRELGYYARGGPR